MIEVFGKRAFALIFAILLAGPALSLPGCGATHVFKLIAIVLALELIGGRDEIWLPARWRARKVNRAVDCVGVVGSRRVLLVGRSACAVAALVTALSPERIDRASRR